MRSLQDDSQRTQDLEARLKAVYDIPFISDFLRRHRIFAYIPICPPFGTRNQQRPVDQEEIVHEAMLNADTVRNVDVSNVWVKRACIDGLM